ncbi:MAG: nucleotidyltransferase family protein [Candidatus Aminicenantales bacterium]
MSTDNQLTGLAAALFGKARRAVLSLLYSRPEEKFHMRNIFRIINMGHGAVQRELKHLADAGIISRTVRGQNVFFQANTESPIFQEVRNIAIRMETPISYTEPSRRVPALIKQRFNISARAMAKFCRTNHIQRLSLFGSVLGDDFRADSDIDVLVEFEPGHVPGFGIVAMENELSRLAGRKVDLRTPRDLSRHFREQVIREAEVRYERA